MPRKHNFRELSYGWCWNWGRIKILEIRSSEVTFPVQVELTTPVFSMIELDGYQGKSENIMELVTITNENENKYENIKEITLKPEKEKGNLPFFKVQQKGKATEVKLTVGAGVKLSADKPRYLELVSSTVNDIALSLNSKKLVLSELTRVKIQGQTTTFKEIDSIFLHNDYFVRSKFGSLQPGKGRQVKLLMEGAKINLAVKSTWVGDIHVEGCSSASIDFQEPKSLSYKPTKKDVYLDISASGLILNEYDLTNTYKEGRDDSSSTGILMKMSGEITSARVSGVEVIPSRLQLIFNRPTHEQGVYGAIALFLVFAGGVFLKRALDVLAKVAIPEK